MGPIQSYIHEVMEYWLGVLPLGEGLYPLENTLDNYKRGSCALFGEGWYSTRNTNDNEYLLCLAMLYTLAEEQGV
jgi:hypothetical protein